MVRQPSGNLVLIGLGYLGFISLGLPDGLLGVAWPSMRTFFHLPLHALGAFLLMFTGGYLVASFSSGYLITRLNIGLLLGLSCLATAVSLWGYALTPWWSGMVALAALAGLGAGGIDAGINTYAATHWSARMVNWSHACYGLGTTTGPVIMTAVLGAHLSWQWGYALVGMGQLLLALAFMLTHQQWPAATTPTTPSAPMTPVTMRRTLCLSRVWLGMAVFFVYTGLEAAIGAWAYSLLHESRGVAMLTAGRWVSIYWGGLTMGRIAAGLLIGRLTTDVLLRACILAIACGATGLWLNLSSFGNGLSLALMGLGCAPIFPSLIATTPARLGTAHAANAIGCQIAAAVLGQSLLPSGLGVLAQVTSLESLAPAFLGTALLLFALFGMLTTSRAMPHTTIALSMSSEKHEGVSHG